MTTETAPRNGHTALPAGITQGYVPFRVDTSRPPVEQSARIPLFYIDDVEYSGPARISASTALKALENVATHGVAYAAFHCLIDAIGREAYDALIDCPQVEYSDAQALLGKITDLYFGQAVDLTGKSPTGSDRSGGSSTT